MPHERYAARPASIIAIVAAALTLAASVAEAADAVESPEPWKLSAAVGPAFALGKAGDRWSKLIGERSGGKIAVAFHPGASLARNDPAREFIALRDGGAELAVGSTLYWSSQVVDLNVFALPWLAPEDRELAALADGAVAERLFAAVERAGAVPLALAVLGHRALAMSGAAPRSPSDFSGMKVRVPSSSLVMGLFVELGALPRTMPAGDAHAAFRAGALVAQEGTLATLAAARLDAFGLKQVMLWDAVGECAVFAANRAAWDAWTDEQRTIVREAARDVARELPALARSENEAAQEALVKRGTTVTRLTASGRAAFVAATRRVYDRWAGAMDAGLVREAEAAVRSAPK
jgi:TRAP-type C4-dicarboxylate transport system substrate-binding protein